jgi:hypothetical protein
MLTHTRPYSWAISLLIIIVFAAALVYALMTSIPVHAAHNAPVPTGWHQLYNEGQSKCLDSGNALQRCDARSEDQQYVALAESDGTFLLLNRATAQCVVADRDTVALRACDSGRRGSATDWRVQRLGGARFHLLSGGRALSARRTGRGGADLTLVRVDNGDLNQDWQWR